MAYVEQNFVKGQVLKAEHLNRIEQGIKTLESDVEKFADSDIIHGVVFSDMLDGVEIAKNKVLSSDGSTFTNDNGVYSTTTYVPIKQGVTYYCGEYRFIALYGSDYKIISLSGGDELNPESFTPTTDGFVRFTVSNREYERGRVWLSLNPKGHRLSVGVEEEVKESIVAPYMNMISRVRTTPGYIFANNTPVSNDNYCYTTYVPVEAGVEYVVYPRVRSLNIHDSAKKILSNLYNSNDSEPVNFIPEVDGYVRITLYAVDYDADLCGMCKKSDYLNGLRGLENSLSGISIYTFGDSIMATRSGVVNTIDLLRNNHGIGGMNYGVGGYTLARFDGSERGSILNKIDSAREARPDIVLLEGGCNDYSLEVPLGVITDYLDFSGNYDETTYLGAIEKALYTLKNKYKDTPIIWIFVHKQSSRTEKGTVNFNTMHDKSLEVCKKWSIPVVDMYNEGGLNMILDYHKQTYSDGADGVHPNSLGHEKFYYPMIFSKIKQVLGI